MNKIKLSLFLFATGATLLFAGGYRVNLQGVRQTAMGITTSVHAQDASVAFYNPAGLAFVDADLSIAAGGYGIFSKAEFTVNATGTKYKTDNDIGTPLYGAISYRPAKGVTLGFSFTTPFGSSVKWGNTWPGNISATETKLKSYFLQPTVAIKFNDWFSIGGGFIYALGEVDVTSSNPAGNILTTLYSKKATGTGFNIGAYIRANDKLNIAASYRSKVDLEVDGGDVIVNGTNATTFTAELPGASELNIGVSYKVTPKLLLAGEMNVEGWRAYQNLVVTTPAGTSTIPRNYESTISWHLGLEYQATDMIAVRGGYYYDPSPSPASPWSAQTPSTDASGITGGLGFKIKDFNVDLTGLYLIGGERGAVIEGVIPGTAKTSAFVGGLGLSYNMNFK